MNRPKPTRTAQPALCRLTAWFASRAPVAVLLRRGPGAWVQMIKWRVEDDTLACGQWLKGRIREEVSDLSEDGELFLYLARQDTRKAMLRFGTTTWTALSRPPFFTALALWPHAGYCGGGEFVGRRAMQLAIPWSLSRNVLTPLPDDIFATQAPGCLSPGAAQAIRHGWRPMVAEPIRFHYHDWQLQVPWIKESQDGALRLIRRARRVKTPGQSTRTVEHYVLERALGDAWIGDADFVEFDQRQRLVMGHKGQLLVCADPYAESLAWRCLHDFSGHLPETVAPPQWARTWPLP
ncbi:hypothetical protein [Chitiniphilus shinanonensis]|uniref:hypothetical protein n=1 Tax=Chitiniphilus shinanonensis TaxID=553088 RepID=UPI00303034C3